MRNAHEGVAWRAGRVEVRLCTTHARVAADGAREVAGAAMRGLGQALRQERPEIYGTLERAWEAFQVVRPLLGGPSAPAEAQPAPTTTSRSRRRVEPDVIDGEIIE